MTSSGALRTIATTTTVTKDSNTSPMSPLTFSTSGTTHNNGSKTSAKTGTPWEDTYYQRIAISQVFTSFLGPPPEKDNYITVAKIKPLFPVYSRCMIQHVIKQTRT